MISDVHLSTQIWDLQKSIGGPNTNHVLLKIEGTVPNVEAKYFTKVSLFWGGKSWVTFFGGQRMSLYESITLECTNKQLVFRKSPDRFLHALLPKKKRVNVDHGICFKLVARNFQTQSKIAAISCRGCLFFVANIRVWSKRSKERGL